MWTAKNWPSEARKKHVDALIKEFMDNPCELLRGHILQLKEAWGVDVKLPTAAA